MGSFQEKFFLIIYQRRNALRWVKFLGEVCCLVILYFPLPSYRRHWRRRNIVVSKRRPRQIFPWRITAEDYYRSISNEMLTEKRLTRLDKITNVQLRELAKLLKAAKKAGYQEHLIDLMVEDIKAIK